MTRSRASAKQAGTKFASLIADCLAKHTGQKVERRALFGSKDRGDVVGLSDWHLGEIVVECKDYAGRVEVGPWLNEAERERLNAGAGLGVVIAKRRGISDPLEQTCLMTVASLIALLTGETP